MSFGTLSKELTEAVAFKVVPHPGKGVPLPDDLFTDPKDPVVKQAAVDAVKKKGAEERKQFVTLFIYNLFGEMHSADLLTNDFSSPDLGTVGYVTDLAAFPYTDTEGRPVEVDVGDRTPRVTAFGNTVPGFSVFHFDSKGRFMETYKIMSGAEDRRKDTGRLRAKPSYRPSGKVKSGGRFVKEKFQSANLSKTDYAHNVRFFQNALNGQPVKPQALRWDGEEGAVVPSDVGSDAVKVVDDVAAIAILKACSDMVFSMEGSAEAAGDYKKVSPLDTGETTTMSRWFGYTRPYKFTLTAPLKIDGLTDDDKSVIKNAVQAALKFIGGTADYASGNVAVKFTKVVDIPLGTRVGRYDSETMGSLD